MLLFFLKHYADLWFLTLVIQVQNYQICFGIGNGQNTFRLDTGSAAWRKIIFSFLLSHILCNPQ